MNPFDAAICLVALFAIIAGFNAGLLRSLATIFGYAAAAPAAIALSPFVTRLVSQAAGMPPGSASYVAPVLFVLLGAGFGIVARIAVAEFAGEHRGVLDRGFGALLGAVRIGLVAVLLVLVFDRIIPPSREPAWLTGSQLRPWLSAAASRGVKTLPPDAVAAIDRLKRERGI